MTNFKQAYEDAYWVLRAVIETASISLTSPHPLWGELNELVEVRDRMERTLDIANRSDVFALEAEHD